jgi:hypothetical protein
LATTLLAVTAIGVLVAAKVAPHTASGPLETSRNLAFGDRMDWNQFQDPDAARRFEELTRRPGPAGTATLPSSESPTEPTAAAVAPEAAATPVSAPPAAAPEPAITAKDDEPRGYHHTPEGPAPIAGSAMAPGAIAESAPTATAPTAAPPAAGPEEPAPSAAAGLPPAALNSMPAAPVQPPTSVVPADAAPAVIATAPAASAGPPAVGAVGEMDVPPIVPTPVPPSATPKADDSTPAPGLRAASETATEGPGPPDAVGSLATAAVVDGPTSEVDAPPMAEKQPGVAGAVVLTLPAIAPAIAPVATVTPPATGPARPAARAPAVIVAARKHRPRAVERDYERPPSRAIAAKSQATPPTTRAAPVRRHRYRESQYSHETGPTFSRRRQTPRDPFTSSHAQPYSQPYAQPWGSW